MFIIYVTGCVQNILNILSAVTFASLCGGICGSFTVYFRVLSRYSRRPEELTFTPGVLLLLFNHHRRRRRNVFCITIRYGLDVPRIECP